MPWSSLEPPDDSSEVDTEELRVDALEETETLEEANDPVVLSMAPLERSSTIVANTPAFFDRRPKVSSN
jgi:hypothetical protein